MKWLPNALSYSRAVLGLLALPTLAWFGLWDWWFWILVLAAFTDFADGGAAILLKCGTQWGKEVLDPRCDAALGVGILISWVIEEDHLVRFLWVILIAVVGELLHRTKQGSPSRFLKIAAITLPICYFTTLYVFGYYFAHLAYGDAMRDPWWKASMLLVPAVLVKLPRFQAWRAGQL